MEQTASRNFTILFLGALMIWGLHWINRHWFTSTESLADQAFSYEMPRPKSFGANFDLSGREIDRDILENPQAIKSEKSAAKNQAQKQGTKPNSAKQSADRKPKFEVNTVDTSRHMGKLTATFGLSGQIEMASSAGAGAAAPRAAAKGVVAPSADTTDVSQGNTHMTPSQWRAELMAKPTADTAAKFVQAHNAAQLADGEFYQISFDFFTSNQVAYHQVGAEILNADTSANSFTQMAIEYSKVPAADRAQLWNILLTFAQPSKFAPLNQGLQSLLSSVEPLALQVLGQAVQHAQTISTQSTGADHSAATSATSALVVFESSLKTVVKSSPTNSSTAQALLTEIQSLN